MEKELNLETLKSELQEIANRYGGTLEIALHGRDVDVSLMDERPHIEHVLDISCKIEILGVR